MHGVDGAPHADGAVRGRARRASGADMDYARQAKDIAQAAIVAQASQVKIMQAQKFQQEQAAKAAEAQRRAAVDGANRQAMQGRQR